jgi:hypothetical protein
LAGENKPQHWDSDFRKEGSVRDDRLDHTSSYKPNMHGYQEGVVPLTRLDAAVNRGPSSVAPGHY